jgi:hypothetical protein
MRNAVVNVYMEDVTFERYPFEAELDIEAYISYCTEPQASQIASQLPYGMQD